MKLCSVNGGGAKILCKGVQVFFSTRVNNKQSLNNYQSYFSTRISDMSNNELMHYGQIGIDNMNNTLSHNSLIDVNLMEKGL